VRVQDTLDKGFVAGGIDALRMNGELADYQVNSPVWLCSFVCTNQFSFVAQVQS